VKPKKTVLENLTTRYQLVVRNEENLAEKPAIGFTYMKLFVLGVLGVTAVFIFCFLLSKTLLALWFDPNQANIEIGRELKSLTFIVDSLARETDKKEKFIQSMQHLIMGDPVPKERTKDSSKLSGARAGQENINTPHVSAFHREYELTDTNIPTKIRGRQIEEFDFFPPVSGMISSGFNEGQGHFGADIVTKADEPVKAVADGTVTLASWTQDGGYVIIIQHKSNLISIYKHNAELAKKVGNFVSAGDIISIVGNTGELTDGPHLHFELWYDGEALNPEDFVNFR